MDKTAQSLKYLLVR